MASSSLKGTRKTYSFEEREILTILICKYNIEDKKSDLNSMLKRKSAWSLLAEEYNTCVGPQAMRSALQLRRCWENMKACKKNREEKKLWAGSKSFCKYSKDHGRLKNRENRNGMPEFPTSTPGSVGLPPNVVFEPKESEPFTLQSVCPLQPLKLNFKKEDRDSDSQGGKSVLTGPAQGSMESSSEKSPDDLALSNMDRSDETEISEKGRPSLGSNAAQTFGSPSISQEQTRKTRKFIHFEEELHALALAEAQIKVDIAATLKEEAKIKLEEAQYRREEARLRMLFFTNKLDRMKED